MAMTVKRFAACAALAMVLGLVGCSLGRPAENIPGDTGAARFSVIYRGRVDGDGVHFNDVYVLRDKHNGSQMYIGRRPLHSRCQNGHRDIL